MTCKKCGAEVPDNKLVCDCFQVEADNEAKRIGVARFRMTCTKCGAEVPDNKLVCDCFQVEADNEAKRIGVARFMADQGSLFLTCDHLLPASRNSLTLCGLTKPSGEFRRFKNPEVSEIRRAQLQKPWSDRICKKCMEIVTQMAAAALLQSANAEGPQPTKGSLEERQPQITIVNRPGFRQAL